MAVRYPEWTRDEGAAPSSTGSDANADATREPAGEPAGEPARELAHPPRLPRHTPARGTGAIAPHTHASAATAPHAHAGAAITCAVPAAVAALVREALAIALPDIPLTVSVDDAVTAGGTSRRPMRGRRGADAGARTGAHTGAKTDADADVALAAAWVALRQTQRRVAAGDVAMRLRHALANPLTALLFEAQLLQMETLPPATAEAVGRIVTQCRRTIEVARQLDVVGAPPAAPSPRHDIRNPM